MAREIIAPGPGKWRKECTRCGAVYTYTLDDVSWSSFVSCPHCGERSYHVGWKGDR